jgi:hypothetical protein
MERMTLPDQEGNERASMKIEGPRSLFVHRSTGGYFCRSGSSKRRMSPDFWRAYFNNEANDDLCNRFRCSQSRDEKDVLLDKLAMARPQTNARRLSLCFQKHDDGCKQEWRVARPSANRHGGSYLQLVGQVSRRR